MTYRIFITIIQRLDVPNSIMFLQHPTFPQLRINRFITDNGIGLIAIYKETLLRCIKC